MASTEGLKRVTIGRLADDLGMSKAGLPRLWTLCAIYLEYVAAGVFPGGDFFVTVANEYDTRPGPVRDEIARAITVWMRRLEGLIADAVERGHLAPTDPVQLAFELEALMVAGNQVYQLNNDPQALELARAGSPGGWRTCAPPRRPPRPGRASPPRASLITAHRCR